MLSGLPCRDDWLVKAGLPIILVELFSLRYMELLRCGNRGVFPSIVALRFYKTPAVPKSRAGL